ncbi:hypothetical protein BJY00DRAFT_312028 [Aspergillus carlsbadensis]|nr:hypothetical protein BJY00DRAFT_312028 [Aspergillus carlsbadensis]
MTPRPPPPPPPPPARASASTSRSRSRTPPTPNPLFGFGPLKSRRGCKTCKTRRVKCGEEKPSCLRCSSTGRKCEYDARANARLGTYSSASASTVVSLLEFDKPRSPGSSSSSPSSGSSSNSVWRERRAFAYYFQHAASFVGGLDADFWSSVVPQVCRIEPAVWDAIIALSAMFETHEDSHSYTTSSSNNNSPSLSLTENRRDALAWYSRAVSAVRLRIERGFGDVFIGLISCVLFICIEALQGSTEEAIRLYAQGVQLIVALRAQIAAGGIPASKASLLEDTIVPIFVRLAIMALTVSGVSVENLMAETAQLLTGFASLKAAREALVLLTIEVQQFQGICEEHHAKVQWTGDIPPGFIAQQAALFSRLRNWHTAFTTLTHTLRPQPKNEPPAAKESSTIALLSAYHEMAYTLTAICISPRKTLTDSYVQNFQNIVDHSRAALDASARSDGSQPPFTFDIGVGFPIWFTCLRCADPGIRRQALALLRRAPLVEGFYGNRTVTVSAEAIMVIEESLAMAINAVRQQRQQQQEEDPGVNAMVDTSRISIFDANRFAAVGAGAGEGQKTALPTLTAAEIPEEARIKPLVPFRPRDGIPPGLSSEGVERWGRAGDCWFLVFSRLDRDRGWDSVDADGDGIPGIGNGNGVWREVFDCIPAEMYP